MLVEIKDLLTKIEAQIKTTAVKTTIGKLKICPANKTTNSEDDNILAFLVSILSLH